MIFKTPVQPQTGANSRKFKIKNTKNAPAHWMKDVILFSVFSFAPIRANPSALLRAMRLSNGLRPRFFLLGFVLFLTWGNREARAANEIITVPVVLADYYGWAYTEAFEDHADIYGYSTAGVDALGWTLFFTANDYDAGLFLVNTAGLAKTLYPMVTLLGASDSMVQNRAWIALGTHTATLLTLQLLGRPALNIQSTLGPHQDGYGVSYAFDF